MSDEVRLATLPVGARFVLRLETTGREITGEVVRCNMGSVTVDQSGLPEKGELRGQPGGLSHWDSSTLVELVSITRKEGRE